MFKWLRNAAIDRELTEILNNHQRVRQDATEIRKYVLWVLEQDRSGEERFSDEALQRAAELYEDYGAGALYWITDIAAQLALLAEANLRGQETNVGAELGKDASAHDIIKLVAQIP